MMIPRTLAADDATVPSLGLFVRELPAVFRHPPFAPVRRLADGRQGGGRAVMVVPGFLAGDLLTLRLRRVLIAAGYRARGWGLGVNRGARADLLARMATRLDELDSMRPVSLVGWSLGGLYARELAKLRPGKVDRVITLGSPFSGDLRANRAWKLYERVNGHPVDRPPMDVALAAKPPVPTFALWSAKDGIVAPASARGEMGEADYRVEVPCQHMDFISAPAALSAILDALAVTPETGPPPPRGP